jgi:hypothetical protein
MIVFKLKTYSTPVGRGLYRAFRLLPGQTHMSAGRKAIKTKRVLNDQAKMALKNPVSATLGTAVPVPGATVLATNTVGRYVESPVLTKVAPRYGQSIERLVNRNI